MKKLVWLLLTTILTVGLYSQVPCEPISGKDIFLARKCDNCHAFLTHQIVPKKSIYIDLSKGLKLKDTTELRSYIKKEFELNGKKHPLPFKGDSIELNIMTRWMFDNQDTTKILQ